eukprot:6233179-Pyramimonas_sp.AAC.1
MAGRPSAQTPHRTLQDSCFLNSEAWHGGPRRLARASAMQLDVEADFSPPTSPMHGRRIADP